MEGNYNVSEVHCDEETYILKVKSTNMVEVAKNVRYFALETLANLFEDADFLSEVQKKIENNKNPHYDFDLFKEIRNTATKRSNVFKFLLSLANGGSAKSFDEAHDIINDIALGEGESLISVKSNGVTYVGGGFDRKNDESEDESDENNESDEDNESVDDKPKKR